LKVSGGDEFHGADQWPADARTGNRDAKEFYEAQKTFMPRIDFLSSTDDWVVRAGFGIYYNVHQLNNYTILNLNPPKSGTSTFANTATGGRITNGPNQPILTYPAPFGVVNPTNATGVNALSPDNNQPYVSQWSFDVSGDCRSTR
jgi:hypothetical protein